MEKRFLPHMVAVLALTMIGTGVGRSALAVGTVPAVKSVRSLSERAAAAQTGPRPLVMLAVRPGQAQTVARLVRKLGGQVERLLPDVNFLFARVPARAVDTLEQADAVIALAVDRPVKLDHGEMARPAEVKSAQPAPVNPDPAASMQITATDIQADKLATATGNDGRGVTVAILDTGVDPGHPDLLQTSDGQVKIVDWQDFTGEGDIQTGETAPAPEGILSKGGEVRLGALNEQQIPPGEMNSDLNRNGKNDDKFPVLLTDPVTAGVFDTAYIDTNQNGRFDDDKPLHTYQVTHEVGVFGSTDKKEGVQQGVNFVVTRINADGSGLNVGYDGGLHGTHVAGIVAANGAARGMAPGARIMAIKVLNSGGSGSWAGILQGMHYAAANGAKVINMSLGGMSARNDGKDPESLLVGELTAKFGSLFSIAAGNSGPGLNTVGLPGVAADALTAGAYISPATWRNDYGLTVPEEGLWYFSSQGPRDDGVLKPNLVAPGSARSPVPGFAGYYQVFQGTSMATPHASGAAALLMGAAGNAGLQVGPNHLKAALQQSARRLNGYGWAEQGHGLIQLTAAWQRLQRLAGEADAPVAARGAFERTGATMPVHYLNIYNRGYAPLRLDLDYRSGSGGLQATGPRQVAVGWGGSVRLPVTTTGADRPGYYDALVTARGAGRQAAAVEYLVAQIVPHTFDPDQGNVIKGISGKVKTAKYDRQFIQVPPGTAQVVVRLSAPELKGRVRLVSYDPDGMPGPQSGYAGAPSGPEMVEMVLDKPRAGVWELDVYASHGGMLYDLADNRYSMEVQARGVYPTPLSLQMPPLAFGGTYKRQVSFHNLLGDLKAGAVGMGFARAEQNRLEVEQGGYKNLTFDVAPDTALLDVHVGQAADKKADLDVNLYYNHPQLGWLPVAAGKQMRVPAPEPGQYTLEVTGLQVPSGRTTVTAELTRVSAGSDIRVQDKVQSRPNGSRWTVPVSIRVPARVGKYLGAVAVKDDEGKIVQVVPVEVR